MVVGSVMCPAEEEMLFPVVPPKKCRLGVKAVEVWWLGALWVVAVCLGQILAHSKCSGKIHC